MEIVDLTNKFDTGICKEEFYIVDYFTPWCQHCTKFKPLYIEIEKELRDTCIHFAQVDCQEDPDTCKIQDVKYYPMITVYHNGQQQTHFTGNQMEKEVLVKWMLDTIKCPETPAKKDDYCK